MSVSRRWWEDPLRILDYCYATEIDTIDFGDYVAFCKQVHANAVHFHCHDNTNGGLDEYSIYHRSRLSKKRNRDVLAEFLPLAHANDIRVIAYLDGHWFPKSFGDQHPDWWVLLHDGTRVENYYGDDDLTFCLNSAWRDWHYTLIEDMFQYELDGILFDGPIYVLGRGACYCEACKAKFAALYRREMPPPDRGNSEDWGLLKQFAMRSTQDYYRDAHALIKRINPDAFVYLNGCPVGEPGWLCGRQNRPLMPFQDGLIAEGGFHYGRLLGNMLKTGASSKLYETQAGGKPCFNAVSPAFGSWRRHSMSAPEIRLLLNESAVGASPYMAVFIEGKDAPGIRAAGEVFAFLEANADCFRATASAANVAILYSSQTVDNYTGVDIPHADISGITAQAASAIGSFSRSFWGFYEMLFRARIPFDVIDEVVIEGAGLDRYRALILPNCACLSAAQCEALTAWVQRGGCLVADFETSHFDESGQRLPQLGLATLFGASSQNVAYGPRRWDFVHILDMSAPAFAGQEQDVIPAPRYNLRVQPTSGSVSAVFGKPLVSNIVRSYEPSDEPFLVEHRVGAGVSYYFPTTLGEMFEGMKIMVYQRIAEALVRRHVDVPVDIQSGPHLLNIHLREQAVEGRTLLHLMNYEISAVDAVIPATDVRISMAVAEPPARIRALRATEDLAFEYACGRARFTLQRLDEYEVIAVER